MLLCKSVNRATKKCVTADLGERRKDSPSFVFETGFHDYKVKLCNSIRNVTDVHY